MKKIRTGLTALLMMISAACLADGFDYLWVEQSDGTTSSTALASFDQIKFDAGQMLILNGGTTMGAYPLTSLKRMYFGEGVNGIEQMENTVTDELMEVYTTSGMLIRRGATTLSDLPRGIYIIKQGSLVRKVQR